MTSLVVRFIISCYKSQIGCESWWRHQMEAFSALLAICAGNSPVPGEFPTQRPVARSFDVYFDLHPNKWLSKQSWGWWFETLSCSLWRHRNCCYDLETIAFVHILQGYLISNNTLRLRRNRHFADDIFKCIFLNENVWISIKISLNFVSKGQIHNIRALIQIMAWRRPGDKPLAESMVFRSLTHMRHSASMS